MLRLPLSLALLALTLWVLLPGDLAAAGEKEARHLVQNLTRLFVKESVPDSVTEEAGALLYRLFI